MHTHQTVDASYLLCQDQESQAENKQILSVASSSLRCWTEQARDVQISSVEWKKSGLQVETLFKL